MSIEARRDVFQAIADPTRRQIITLIALKPMNLNAIADNFYISQPAISQQIKILVECGLVIINQQGRERFCEARLDSLDEVSSWVEMSKKLWTSRLDRMDSLLTELQSKKTRSTNKTKHLKSKKK
jgi:DNA-binding transcriptional ArsR family regulator